ncbi:uncharacterized protein [Dermacentor albipictus]|uniref:uncharacterized protein n=1 Tax=Dermacentor albipictus TaxID=60249 RepID=UPI0038FD32F7
MKGEKKKKKKPKSKSRRPPSGSSQSKSTAPRGPQPGAGSQGPSARESTQGAPPSKVTEGTVGPSTHHNTGKEAEDPRVKAQGDQRSWAARVQKGPKIRLPDTPGGRGERSASQAGGSFPEGP